MGGSFSINPFLLEPGIPVTFSEHNGTVAGQLGIIGMNYLSGFIKLWEKAKQEPMVVLGAAVATAVVMGAKKYWDDSEKQEAASTAAANSAHKEYSVAVAPSASRVRQLCRNYTFTSCDTPKEIMPFIAAYSLKRAQNKHPGYKAEMESNIAAAAAASPSLISPPHGEVWLDRPFPDADVDVVHNFGKESMSFWKRLDDGALSKLSYPNVGERKEFLTFVFYLYCANNICGERVRSPNALPHGKPPYTGTDTFARVRRNLKDQSVQAEVDSFQEKAYYHMERIRHDMWRA